MKKLQPLVAAFTAAALLAACTSGTGVRFSDLFDESAAAEGTGIQFSGVVRAVVILATHDATARQRQVAEQNGRRAVAKLKARLASAPQPTTPNAAKKAPQKPTAVKSTAVSKPDPATAPQVASQPRKKIPRIIAVATEKDEKTDKKAARAVMLFDTHAETIIGNKVYDIENEPSPGDAVRFETHSTSYVGASL